jgi:hypothetical protein
MKKLSRKSVLAGYTYFGWMPYAKPIGKRLFGSLFEQLSATRTVTAGTCAPADRGPSPYWAPESSAGVSAPSTEKPAEHAYVLYRIIGNDLEPRHRKGQALANLQFILDNEPPLENCEKRFVVNRLVDREQEASIIRLLESSGYCFQHLKFNPGEYAQICWDIEGVPAEFAPFTQSFYQLTESEKHRVIMRVYRHKNNYVMNNNGARNSALAEGRMLAQWVLPWDGNCFVTERAWREILEGTSSHCAYPYHIVPMARILDNTSLLRPGFRPNAEEEPQIIFRSDARESFDPDFFYGRRPKVELLWRLGVPGPWDRWRMEPWDLPCPPFSPEAGAFKYSGWVARLFSGQPELEKNSGAAHQALVDRGLARNVAIESLLKKLDDSLQRTTAAPGSTVYLRCPDGTPAASASGAHVGPLIKKLEELAENAMTRGPFSVIDKTTLPPSRNRNDYWHPAPYYWPHPLRLPFLPYVHRDGMRVPGTKLYEPLSDRFDRTRLQRLFDDTYVLVLAYKCVGTDSYAQHARLLVSRWFVETESAMTPHLKYAQVRRGHDGNRGSRSGIIEMKDMYFFLDAVRILIDERVLSSSEQSAFADWLDQYLGWLLASDQGKGERAARNNHGTYFDLQVASIANFLGRTSLVRDTLRDSRFRLSTQFEPDGSQPEELRRTLTAHYCCFNLQGWIHLAELAECCGEDLWGFRGPSGQGIERGMEWLSQYFEKPWPFQQIMDFDDDRFLPIAYAYDTKYVRGFTEQRNVRELQASKPLFHPHDGIHPFWQLKYAAL